MTEANLLYGKLLVKPANLEAELEKIRITAAIDDTRKEVEKSGSAPSRAKATLSNFIIINLDGNKESEKNINQLIDHICYAYPSRFFVIDSELKSGTIASSVSSRCFLADSGTHVCSEEVYLSATAAGVKLVPNILLSLLAPDVANVVLLVLPKGVLQLDSVKKDLLERIFKLSNKVILDSRNITNLNSALTEVLNLNSFGFYDLNWRRSRKLRNLIREVFDAEILNNSASCINKISLSCPDAKQSLALGVIPATALLLGAWMLSSLEQTIVSKVKKAASSEVVFVCQGKKCNLDLLIGPSDISQSDSGLDISELRIEFADASLEGVLSIKLDQVKQTAEIKTKLTGLKKGNSEVQSRTVPLAIPKFEDLLLHEVITSKEDEGFIKACRMTLELSKLA